MFWNIYVAQKNNMKAEKKRLAIPGTQSIADQRAANIYASQHFNVALDLVMCIPTPKEELN